MNVDWRAEESALCYLYLSSGDKAHRYEFLKELSWAALDSRDYGALTYLDGTEALFGNGSSAGGSHSVSLLSYVSRAIRAARPLAILLGCAYRG